MLTRRNLMLCLTVAVTVAAWYAGPGLSYLPIAGLVVGLPIPLALSRLLAARHDRLELGLLRHPLLASSRYQSGNNVVIDIGGGRYLLMGHLSPGSIQVNVGDQVKLGQQIAKVGNSGNTTEPHLHIQAQTIGTSIGDVETLDVSEVIRTLHTYPLVFSNVVLTRQGDESRPLAADPRRGDLLRPAD